jgi:hypothetical protein
MDGRDEPGHDEKASHFQAVRKSLKMLAAFSVRLLGDPERTSHCFNKTLAICSGIG